MSATADPPPPVAVSCGDPAGIGPEIMAAAWRALRGSVSLVWIGDPSHLPRGLPRREVSGPEEAAAVCPAALPVLSLPFPARAVPGRLDLRNAPAVVAAIDRAVDLALAGRASALCTLPIHKAALADGAGFGHPGHTEYLADRCGAAHVVMMIASPLLRVVPATIHVPLRDVPAALDARSLRQTILVTAEALRRDFGVAEPRIAVAGLNPHAGEDGKIGREEIEVIAPVVRRLAAEGHRVFGPLSADTMFHPAARGTFDAAVCMYHDQALVPVKTVDFAGGVNVTLGLPVARTSPDHGTALDIAGRGVASAESLIAALAMADDMGRRRRAAAAA